MTATGKRQTITLFSASSETTEGLTKPILNACLYYGTPRAFSPNRSIEDSATLFAKHDLVVWGDFYHSPLHSDYANTMAVAKSMLKKNPDIGFYGYVPIGLHPDWEDSNLPMEELKARVLEWKALGATGVFADEFGFDYYITRERQNEFVNFVHEQGMNVIANSWRIEYVFSTKNMILDWMDNFEGNPNLMPPAMGENDYYMYENAWYDCTKEGVTSVSYAKGTPARNRMMEAYDYHHAPQEEYGGKTYYEQFKSKTIALDAIGFELPKEERERYFMNGLMASILMNVDAYCGSTNNWGSGGRYHVYNMPTYFELAHPHKHVIQATRRFSHYEDVFVAEIGSNTLELVWVDGKTPDDPQQGIHEARWNGVLVDTIDFAKGQAVEPTSFDVMTHDPAEPKLGQVWYRADSVSDHPVRIMTTAGIRGVALVEPIDNTPPPKKTIVTDGLVGYWNAKQGLAEAAWANIAPGAEGTLDAVNTGIVVDEKGAKFSSALSSKVDIPNQTPFIDTTMEIWFTHDAIQHSGHWLFGTSSGNRAVIYKDNYTNVRHTVNGTAINVSASQKLTPGIMHHMILRIVGDKTDVFINGVKTPAELLSGPFEWRKNLYLGTNSGSDYKMDGYIHSFRLYNRGLSDFEIEHNREMGIEIGL